ncbi:MAG: polysaccharide biosynthesis protein, partial [Methylotenera sp.]|nr:polysaccharide biosynthesis protein [Methylotenera sp.]
MKLAKRIGWLVALDIIGAYVAGLLGTTLILFGRWEWGLVEAWTQFALVFLPMQLLVNAYFGLYTNIWNYASLPELANILGASTVGAVFVLLVLGFRTNFQIIAFRTVPLYWLLSTGVFGGIRFSIRFLRERSRGKYQDGDKTLIIGAGDAGFLFTREIAKHPELKLYPIGFLDDDPNKLGMKINDVKVVAHTDKLEYVIEKYEVVKVILAIPSASPQFIRDMVNRCNAVGIKVLTVPGLFELVNGQASISKIRAVQLEDLLNRTEIKVDLSEIGEYVSGKVVLVTGAGGSIGSELCRQISTLMPSKLILLGHGENSIYEIHKELLGSKTHIDLVPIIADVQDKPRLRSVFGALRPQVVFHAAAHKHVPLMENNPVEAI